ncbi:FK506-binding protein 5-like [Notothenia coriiceps]|uniref:FK506-binding protein 5-like n=1 Tax=Notothenia coriiceps TaxID=8208 RepID=A0A6I9P173_9TELE|nr:PREDICTED: FK506-binding protein 5-like [Notothenia coriiceps]
MFCPGCGIKVESSYNFCPGCAFKLSDLIRNQNHDVSTSAHHPSITAQEKNQKEEQDQVSTDVDEKQENTAQIKGQLASDDLEPDKDGAAAQDPSDKTASQATLEKGAMPPSPKETLGVAEAVTTKKTQVIDAIKEEERLAATAPESNAQPCREAAPGSNLSVCLTPPSSTQAGDKPVEQQTEAPSDNSKDNSPHAEKPSDITLKPSSNSASNLKSTTETVSIAPETPQQCDSVAKQSTFEQGEDKTISHDIHNLSGRPDDNHTNSEQQTFVIQTDRREDEAARDQSNSDDPDTKTTEFSTDQHSVTKETAQSTEADEPKSDTKINTEAEKQQQGNSDGVVSRSKPSCPPEKVGIQVAANILETSVDLQTPAPQTLPNSEYIPVYFHAVTSKDFHLDPGKDEIFLMSGDIFGDWQSKGLKMSFSSQMLS